ncbi:3-oxoadipate enol-lactonase [Nocardia sp. 348MFTsu5.1]|uniref:3-oxoadipate enol-lactonase n=1 Tax=Nocardia sp. 348MFTsu5.1 TaxID=1172185 RepID=UPI0003AB098E|nr:3-oxoadipate enol-lactonase [Nocardia sp. 348MFTsu5.1]
MSVQLGHVVSGTDDSAQTVVLLGSLGSTSAMWDPQRQALADDGFRVIAMDLRGHGDSPTPPGPYSVAELADDVIATLDSLGVSAFHVVGLSLGGAVAQQLAISYPARVTTLALLCTAAKFGEPDGWFDRAATVRAQGTAAIADAVVARWFTMDLAGSDTLLVHAALDMVTGTDDEGYAACCDALAHWDSRDDLAAIGAPTLAIAGAQDPSTPPATLQVLVDGIAGSRLEILDPGAHLVNQEQPTAVSALLRDHILRS